MTRSAEKNEKSKAPTLEEGEIPTYVERKTPTPTPLVAAVGGRSRFLRGERLKVGAGVGCVIRHTAIGSSRLAQEFLRQGAGPATRSAAGAGEHHLSG